MFWGVDKHVCNIPTCTLLAPCSKVCRLFLKKMLKINCLAS